MGDSNASQSFKLKVEETVIMAMTETKLRKLCRDNELYSTPGLNDVLYCNFQGFTSISGLENYTALKALFLEGNSLCSLEGLPHCTLTCL